MAKVEWRMDNILQLAGEIDTNYSVAKSALLQMCVT